MAGGKGERKPPQGIRLRSPECLICSCHQCPRSSAGVPWRCFWHGLAETKELERHRGFRLAPSAPGLALSTHRCKFGAARRVSEAGSAVRSFIPGFGCGSEGGPERAAGPRPCPRAAGQGASAQAPPPAAPRARPNEVLSQK